jgi:predicted lactoylglutathione lyase
VQMNQVALPVQDMKRSTGFYRKLGFLQIVDTPHYARFECEGGATFSLSLSDQPFNNGAVIYFEHKKLDDWVKSLLDKGVKFEQEPVDTSYLWREAILKDPDGNKIKLYWAGGNRLYPPWRVELKDD